MTACGMLVSSLAVRLIVNLHMISDGFLCYKGRTRGEKGKRRTSNVQSNAQLPTSKGRAKAGREDVSGAKNAEKRGLTTKNAESAEPKRREKEGRTEKPNTEKLKTERLDPAMASGRQLLWGVEVCSCRQI